jgi:hypothetical protein
MDNSASFLAQCDALTSGRSPLQILGGVRSLLRDEGRWCQQAQARDSVGRTVRTHSPDAAAWSIEGAVARSSNNVGIVPPSMLGLLDQMVIDFLGLGTEAGIWEDRDVSWFNDNFDHASVLEFLGYVGERVAVDVTLASSD